MSETTREGEVHGLEDGFRFRCAPGVPCFNECCRDVNIFLGPYDVLRLRQALGLTAEELIERHTTAIASERRLLPLITLKMNESDLRCPFVTEEGCSVYSSRPWACRMFPLDVTEDGKSFRVVIGEQRCKGLEENLERRVVDYLNDQGTPKYQVMDDLLGGLVNDPRFRELDIDNEQVEKMVFMALYDLDSFRRFIFESSFLKKLEVDPTRLKRLERDDEELLRLGFEWLEFGLLGKKVLKVRAELLEERDDPGAEEGGR